MLYEVITIALKVTTRDGRAPLDGSAITDARQDFDQRGASPEVSMKMNADVITSYSIHYTKLYDMSNGTCKSFYTFQIFNLN